MIIRDIIEYLNTIAPPIYQEEYDNIGLQTGDAGAPVKGILVTLDVNESTLDEAIDLDCNLIVSHHPVIFKPISRIVGGTRAERCIIKAIRHNLALFVMHTNLDNAEGGLNHSLARLLGIANPRVISHGIAKLCKMVVYCPEEALHDVRDAMFAAGAGKIGLYEQCSFSTQGEGTFRPLEGSKPYTGTQGEMHHESEIRVEMIVPEALAEDVVHVMKLAHPYEEVAYDVIPLLNANTNVGAGAYGDLHEPLSSGAFLDIVKSKLGAKVIRHTVPTGKQLQKVAVCGGSGGFLINSAIRMGMDALVTSDIKYHQFMEAEGRILLVDAGHYETENIMTTMMYEAIQKKFPNFACFISKHNANPVIHL